MSEARFPRLIGMTLPRVIWWGGGAPGHEPWARIVQLREPGKSNWLALEQRADYPDALGQYGWTKVDLHSSTYPPVEALALSIVAPVDDLAKALEVLRRAEWNGGDVAGNSMCPWCCADKYHPGNDDLGPHEAGCELAALLAKYPAPPEP